MTQPLDAATKKLHAMTLGQIADGMGGCKAKIADATAQYDVYKDEAIRRQATGGEGALFAFSLAPPSEQQRLDREKIDAIFNPAFVAARLTKTVVIGWVLHVTVRTVATVTRRAA